MIIKRDNWDMIIKRQKSFNKAAYEGLGLIKRLKFRNQRNKIAKNLKESVRKADLEFFDRFSPSAVGGNNPEYARAFLTLNKQTRGINRKIGLEQARSAAEAAKKNLLK